MYGWRSKEAVGRNTHELLKTEFSEPAEHIEATLLRQGQWEGEAIHHKRDGTRVIVASRWALQRDAMARRSAFSPLTTTSPTASRPSPSVSC